MILILILLTLLPFRPSCPESEPPVILIGNEAFRSDAVTAIDSLYNRNPAAVERSLAHWREACPDHPIWRLLDAMEFWWIVLDDLFDHQHDERFFRMMEEADSAAEALLARYPSHPDGHIIRAVANGYVARHHANRNRWIRSVRTARHAMAAHQELGRLVPDLTDNLFAEGLKRYYSAWLPEAYPLLRPLRWMLPEGDKVEGLQLLDEAGSSAVFTRPEAVYFSAVILMRYEGRYAEASERFRELATRYPDNSTYRRLLARSLFRQGEDWNVVQLARDAESHWRQKAVEGLDVMMEELHYWSGRSLMRMGRDREALEQLKSSLEAGNRLPNRNERSFLAFSGYLAGQASEAIGEPAAARNYYRQVVELECEEETRKLAAERLSEL